MASVTMASLTLRPSLRVQHRQPARQSVARRAAVLPVAQQKQQTQQQRKVRRRRLSGRDDRAWTK